MATITNSDTLARFLAAMDGEWVVLGYDICEDGRVQVNYQSSTDIGLTWAHRPFFIAQILPVGAVVRLGAVKMRDAT